MTLSILIIAIFPLFLIPTIILPTNKLKIYTYCSMIASSFFLLTFILNLLIPSLNIETIIGKTFLPLFSFIDKQYLKIEEVYHISFYLTCIFFYLLFYIISILSIKKFYIGKNPSMVKPLSRVEHILYILLFLIFTYVLLSFSLIQIRIIIPLKDGFLENFFSIFYIIEA